MDSAPARSRTWWLLITGIVAFVVAFDLLERAVGPEPAASDPAAIESTSPAPPELRRLDDGAIEIRHDFFRRTTIRLGNAADEQALFECLARGIEQTFGEGTAGWSRQRVRRETRQIQDACLGPVHALPAPPTATHG